jgi:uncharacterized membrane protein YphA (DoxX/SURF4 family)
MDGCSNPTHERIEETMSAHPSADPPAAPAAVLPSPELLAKGLATLRIFFGVILFTNGLSKLTGFRFIEIGPYKSNLINLESMRNILINESRVNELPLIKPLVNDVLLPNFAAFGASATALEVVVGLALIVGIATRGAALVDLGQQLFLAALYASSNRWTFEQPHEYVPLIILSIVPAGRIWGLDGWLLRRRPQLRRWPF